MKTTYLLTALTLLLSTTIIAQENSTIEGKSITNELQVVDGAMDGYIMESDSFGNASWIPPTEQIWSKFGSHIYYWDGFVGVGIQPIAPMSIKGSTGFASSNDEAYSLLVDTDGKLSFHANNMLGTGTPTMTLDDSNFKRVGLGTVDPEDKLHVVGGGVRVDETTNDPNPNTAYGNAFPLAYGYFAGTTISTDYGIASITNPSTGNFSVVLDNNFTGAPVVMVTSFKRDSRC